MLFIAWAVTFEQDRYLDKVRKFDFKDREDDRILILETEITMLFNKIQQLQSKFNSGKSGYKKQNLARKINNFCKELERLQKKRIL